MVSYYPHAVAMFLHFMILMKDEKRKIKTANRNENIHDSLHTMIFLGFLMFSILTCYPDDVAMFLPLVILKKDE